MCKKHVPVLLNEVIDALKIKPNGVYVDGTFGNGGHTLAILKYLDRKGKIIVFDKDRDCIDYAVELKRKDDRLIPIHSSFKELKHYLGAMNINEVDGILLDLGVSSMQLDNANRGFSFKHDAPLDMRMNKADSLSAALWINLASEEEISDVLFSFGEEKYSKKIAKNIVEYRKEKRIETTLELSNLIASVVKTKKFDKHPATRSFQAIRIYINKELDDLKAILQDSINCLSSGGRLAIISFHSLEDRIVKQFINDNSTYPQMPKWVALKEKDLLKNKPRLKKIGKFIKPTAEEIAENIRSRSAKLRVAEKL